MYIRRQVPKDYFKNVFYKVRFWFYRNFYKKILKNYSFVAKKEYNLTFNDDFQDITWSASGEDTMWKYGEGWGVFHPDKLNVYYGPPEIVQYLNFNDDRPPASCVEKNTYGLFKVTHKPKIHYNHRTKEDVEIPFEVSLLTTKKYFRQQYGRFECRCTLPGELYTWPAFWMWGSTWPPEIDVFECYSGKSGKDGGKQAINLHYGVPKEGTNDSMRAWSVKVEKHKNLHNTFHEYACEWTPTKMNFYTDNVLIFTYTRTDVLDKWFNDEIAKMWIVINHSLEVDKTPDVPIDTVYSSFLVDYIRAYEFIN